RGRGGVAGLALGAEYYRAKTGDGPSHAATHAGGAPRLLPQGTLPVDPAWILELRPRRLLPPGCEPMALSEQDLLVLHTLMRGAGEIASRQQIVEALGEDYLSYDQRRLDTQMRRLRRKVDEACGLTLPINTARNAGYRFHARALIRA
ncbi:winged helix-turn-helix domain-containing protein, partial [Roseateles sp.]|uniref:winged helix-turn-helix domain-containing protein n=1 Tax=Roseateles sp. TaxID=1971397 RepID=UPI00391D99B8